MKICEHSQYPSRILNLGPPEYEAGVLKTFITAFSTKIVSRRLVWFHVGHMQGRLFRKIRHNSTGSVRNGQQGKKLVVPNISDEII
jgi:hypothetical protein